MSVTVRNSGVRSVVVSVEVLNSQLPKHWTLCQQIRDRTSSVLQSKKRGCRVVYFAEMTIETSMASRNLIGCTKVSLIHPDQILRELVSSQNFKHLGRI